MIHYTKYAEKKFEILNRHKIYFTKEQIEDCLASPETQEKKGKYTAVCRENLKVIYLKKEKVIKIITFFPKNL